MTREKIAWRKGRKIFLEAIFSHSRKLFSKSTYKFLSSLTWYHRLRKFPIILFQEIIIQNYDVYFSLVLHFFALVLNLNCQPALSYVTPLVSPSWPNSTVCTLFLCPHISALFVNFFFKLLFLIWFLVISDNPSTVLRRWWLRGQDQEGQREVLHRVVCNISNTRDSISSDIQTSWRELKIRRVAELFLMKFEPGLECLIYLPKRNKTKEYTEK